MAKALDLIDAEGLEALSMRRLGEELATGAASIYRHVENKNALLMDVLDAMLDTGELPPHSAVGDTWIEQARVLAVSFRASLLRHPRAVPLLAAGQVLGPNALKGRDWGIGLFRNAGFGPELAASSYLSLVHFVGGFVLQEVGAHFRSEEEREELRGFFNGLGPEEYPNIRWVADDLADLDADEEFEFGLQALLDGIAARSSVAT